MSELGAATSDTPSPKLRAAVKAAEPADLIHSTLKKLGPTTYNPGSLVALLGSEPRDTGAIVAAIKICPSLTSKLLGVINSAAFGISRKIDSVERATVLLGPARSRSLAMAYGLRTCMKTHIIPAPNDEA